MNADGITLFVYGTLTSDDLLLALTGRRFTTSPATLTGYARVFPRALGGYPSLVPDPTGQVAGKLIRDIDAASLRALDAYEETGSLYERRPIEVTAHGGRVACEVYFGVDERAAVMSAQPIPAHAGTRDRTSAG